MMKSLKKILLPPGPVLVLTLVGLLLVSALLYYRAVHRLRFIEPALAISQPRLEFAGKIKRLLVKEFGTDDKGVLFMSSTILVDGSLMLVSAHHMESSPVIEKLGRVFLSMLEDPDVRSYIELVMVCVRLPLSPDPEVNRTARPEVVLKADRVLNTLYKAEPRLEKDFGTYFTAAVLPVGPETKANWIEFRIIPTLRLHIDMLQRLEKYAR